MNDDFLSRVHSVLSEAASSYPDGGIKGAVVGTLLRARGINPTAHGYQKIRDLMSALEKAGKVKTGSDGKLAYTVWVIDKSVPARPAKLSTRANSPSELTPAGRSLGEDASTVAGRRMLRQHIYDAFISERLDRPRRMGTTTGALWIGDVPQPATDSKWIELQPISAVEQQGWGLRFLVQKGWESDPDLVDALRSDDWYRSFPLALVEKHGEVARSEWNRRRTARVMRLVDEWASENGLPAELLFEGANAGVRQIEPHDARKRILATLSRLPTAELLRLPIPARYWLSAESDKADLQQRR